MVQHLWLLYPVKGPHRSPYVLNKCLDSLGAGHNLPSLDYIPGTAASTLSHLGLVMRAGV